MDRFNKTIQVRPQSGYHQEQFDIYGRQDRAEEGEGRGRRDRGGRAERSGRGRDEAPEVAGKAGEPG
jgi:ribonuclease G